MSPAEVLEAAFPASECDHDDRAELECQISRAAYDHRARRGEWTWMRGAYISYHTYLKGDLR